jgi:hypothetical protein
MTLLGRAAALVATTPIIALAVVAAPVKPPEAPRWEPQVVMASHAAPVEAGATQASMVSTVRKALAPGVGSERGLQIQTIRVKRAISARFPEIRDIGGWRRDSLKWHPNGLAIDVIIPDWQTPAGRALGDRIADYALDNAERFNVEAVIWQRTYRPADGSPKLMADLGDPDANHYTHVHIATYGGGYPRGGETYFD